MVAINNKTDECWENLTQKRLAQLIHVNPRTVYRWKLESKKVYYKGWSIYLCTKI